MKTKMEYLVYFLLGAVAGLASGLFGIGGGIVIVPILLLSFAAQGISPEVATHVAIATSLACIAVTSFSSIYTHYQKGVLDWRIIKLLIPGIVTGSLIGTLFFVSLEALLLQVLLGGFLIISGLQMLIKRSEGTQVASLKPPVLMLSGIGIGGISSLFGVGGGVFTTPLLTHFGVRIHSAIGIAASVDRDYYNQHTICPIRGNIGPPHRCQSVNKVFWIFFVICRCSIYLDQYHGIG